MSKTILVIGTDITKHDVAAAAGETIESLIALGEEGEAFEKMSAGAAATTLKLYQDGRFDGMIALGGTMGTDLALDCAQALPIGVPKYIVSTVAGSPLIGAERMAADVQFILWAGGLYGLNPLCKSSLSQAAGAVLGAAEAVEPPAFDRPVIGMTSLGSSCLKYMKRLHPELTKRGYDVAVFHTTGMGGMAFERLAADGAFACVMDFSLQELVNVLHGSLVSSGEDRLTGAGRSGTPQMVAPGASDILDLAGWQDIPARFTDRPFHQHNRLIKNVAFNAEEREALAKAIVDRLAAATGPTEYFLPLHGIEEWDKPGQAAHDPEGLAAFISASKTAASGRVEMTNLDCHINDSDFCDAVLDLGAATAQRLADEGAQVILMGRRAVPLEAVAARTGGTVFMGDASSSDDTAKVVALAEDRFRGLDVVVANAGGHGFGTILETDDTEWQASANAILDTSMVLLRAALPALKASRGAICVTASIASLAAPAGAFGYTVMKHAQIGLVRAIARDFGRDGVRCNAVCPGWVTTEMADAEMDELMTRSGLESREAAYAHVTKDVPLGRPASPAEVAAAIAFLCAPEASAITGTVLTVDCGSTIVDVPTLAREL